MKKFTLYSMSILMLGIGTLNSGCMGSWIITKKIYHWNEKATGNKFVDNGIFWILSFWFYPITLVVDFFLLNLIEFWTGSNPMAMAPGEKETAVVKGNDGNQYEMTVTQYRYDILTLTGEHTGQKTTIFYTPETKTWSTEKNGVVQAIETIHDYINKVELYSKDGSVKLVDMNTMAAQGMLNVGF
jgi:hypothetical protein